MTNPLGWHRKLAVYKNQTLDFSLKPASPHPTLTLPQSSHHSKWQLHSGAFLWILFPSHSKSNPLANCVSSAFEICPYLMLSTAISQPECPSFPAWLMPPPPQVPIRGLFSTHQQEWSLCYSSPRYRYSLLLSSFMSPFKFSLSKRAFLTIPLKIVFVFIFLCCVTNHQKLSSLKEHAFIFS